MKQYWQENDQEVPESLKWDVFKVIMRCSYMGGVTELKKANIAKIFSWNQKVSASENQYISTPTSQTFQI